MDKSISKNGKGDERRKENTKKIRDNWAKIKGFRQNKFKSLTNN